MARRTLWLQGDLTHVYVTHVCHTCGCKDDACVEGRGGCAHTCLHEPVPAMGQVQLVETIQPPSSDTTTLMSYIPLFDNARMRACTCTRPCIRPAMSRRMLMRLMPAQKLCPLPTRWRTHSIDRGTLPDNAGVGGGRRQRGMMGMDRGEGEGGEGGREEEPSLPLPTTRTLT